MFIMNCDDFVSVLLCWHMCVYHALCCTLILACTFMLSVYTWGHFLTYVYVTPRFHGYGDVTATYIRRSESAPTYIR